MGIGEEASIDDTAGAPSAPNILRNAWIIGIVVFSAAIVGIATRLDASLASLWPANALLLGIFVRWPRVATWQSWIAAFAAYVLADTLTGTEARVAVVLSLTNMSGVGVGVSIYNRIDPAHRRLRRPESILLLAAISAACATTAAVVGASLAPDRQGEDWFSNYYYWLAAEFSY